MAARLAPWAFAPAGFQVPVCRWRGTWDAVREVVSRRRMAHRRAEEGLCGASALNCSWFKLSSPARRQAGAVAVHVEPISGGPLVAVDFRSRIENVALGLVQVHETGLPSSLQYSIGTPRTAAYIRFAVITSLCWPLAIEASAPSQGQAGSFAMAGAAAAGSSAWHHELYIDVVALFPQQIKQS